MSLRAFVTGVTGFVGSHLARELHRQGWEVHAIVRPASRRDDVRDLPLRIRNGDIVHQDEVLAAMPEGVDAVFHVAASTSVWSGNNDEQDRVNIGGTRNVIEVAVRKRARRFIHTSSFATWGFQDTVLSEHSPRTSATDWINYVRTKHIAGSLVQDAVRAGRLDAVILSPAHILGPGDRRNWSRMMVMVQRGHLPGVPPGGGPFADVREVARAHVTAYHRAGRGETYLLGGENATFLEMIRLVGEILGKPVPTRASPGWQLKATARARTLIAGLTGKEPDITPESAVMIIHHLHCDSTRAQRELDYRVTPLRPLVQDTIDWLWKAGLMA
jgi:nucleoside-diphosphate-sugar epimerase